MLIYAITTHVENEIESQWVDWMRETFIPLMFSTGKFREATFTKVVGASTDGSSYSVQYTTSNRTTLQNFLAEVMAITVVELAVNWKWLSLRSGLNPWSEWGSIARPKIR